MARDWQGERVIKRKGLRPSRALRLRRLEVGGPCNRRGFQFVGCQFRWPPVLSGASFVGHQSRRVPVVAATCFVGLVSSATSLVRGGWFHRPPVAPGAGSVRHQLRRAGVVFYRSRREGLVSSAASFVGLVSSATGSVGRRFHQVPVHQPTVSSSWCHLLPVSSAASFLRPVSSAASFVGARLARGKFICIPIGLWFIAISRGGMGKGSRVPEVLGVGAPVSRWRCLDPRGHKAAVAWFATLLLPVFLPRYKELVLKFAPKTSRIGNFLRASRFLSRFDATGGAIAAFQPRSILSSSRSHKTGGKITFDCSS